MTDIKIKTENIKLDSFLKLIGESESGGQAKAMINSEKVSVNNEVCFSRGKKLFPEDTVSVGENEYRVVSQ